ncbi:unnamed protein product [Lactuca saligna]|uniref:Uncharacterized protein n=1 Tax=Lactuca saligna TaxID=75948 RepID=A0AA36E2W1_LACSI|nr:unnamed protein product [Lactuca saligna]
MSCPITSILTLTVTHEQLDKIYLKYHLIEEDETVIPGAIVIIDRPQFYKIDFYLYYFEVDLGSDDFEFHVIDDILNDNDDEGSNAEDYKEDKEESESFIEVYDSYDTNDGASEIQMMVQATKP